MLCPTCTLRTNCQCACELIEKELAQYEVPLREILMTPKQLERLSDKNSEAAFYRSNNDEFVFEESEALEVFNEAMIKSALEELTPHWEGMTQYQIAEKLGIGRTTVEGHIHAAHTIIRRYLINSLKTPVQTQLYI
jgi:hypothetical protein